MLPNIHAKKCKIYPEIEYKLNFDGCSKGNPGLSGSGAVIYKNGIEIWSDHLFIGKISLIIMLSIWA